MVKMKRTFGKRIGREGRSEGVSGGESDMMESSSPSSDSKSDPYCSNCGLEEENEGVRWMERYKRNNNFRGKESEVEKEEEEERSKVVGLQNQSNGGRHLRPLLFLVIIYLVMMVVTLSMPVVVSAIDLHPHGGFYQRGGGNDFYSSAQSSAQQQSDFGGGDDMIGDMIMTCSRPIKSSRAAKYLAIKQLDIPCDMGDRKSAWCNLPGEKYPWHAVRRFVFENQGLMRRMYGEVRQLSLLRMEFEDDMDDEEEDERHGPPRGPPIPEDHRRNSILTEVLDESLPRVLSDSPPEDQILLRDHGTLTIVRGPSTPRTLSSITTTFGTGSSSADSTTAASTTSAATTTPAMMMASEEQLNATEVMMGVTVESLSGVGDYNNTAAPTMTTTTVVTGGGELTETASTPGMMMTASTVMARNALGEEIVTEEEATQSTASSDGITETEKDDDGEVTITTTEEILMNYSDQDGEAQSGSVVGNGLETQAQQKQQLNDGGILDNFGSMGGTGSMGSDESHDFLNLDKNHILYFDDVGKNRRPVNNGNGDGVAQTQQAIPTSGKLKAVNACPVKEEVVAPYWANNTRGEILALLNLYPFEQYIHWERCNHENKQMFCRQGCRCEQQYRLHRLLAFDPTNECRGIFSDWFRFPSCCVCRCYLNEYELLMLNAAGQEPSSSTTSTSSAKSAQSRTTDRIRSPRKMLLEQLVDGPDVQGVDDMHFFYKQGFYHEHNHGAQPRRKRSLFPNPT